MQLRTHRDEPFASPAVRPPPVGAPDARLATRGERRRSEDPLVGVLLDGRFELRGRVGGDRDTARYRARQISLERDVIVTVVHDAGDDVAPRLVREVRALSRLRSVHTVAPFDAGQRDGLPFLVTEAPAGETLADRLRDTGPLRWRAAARIVSQVAASLAEAHGLGIAHGALDASRVVLVEPWDEEPFAKVCDYGLAALAGGPAADPLSDLRALGDMLCELLTGEPPRAIAAAAAEALPRRLADVPPELQAILLELLAEDPAERGGDARDVRARLVALLRSDPRSGAAPPRSSIAYAPPAVWASRQADATRRSRTGRRSLAPALALACAAAAAVGALVGLLGTIPTP